MQNRKYISVFVMQLMLIVGMSAQSLAQQISVSPIPMMEQLPSNSIQRIFQDSYGYMWYGTLDGLCRYDGYRVVVFRSNLHNHNLLTNNEITAIAEDKNRNMWIGTKKGINIINRQNNKITHLEDKITADQEIKSLMVASDSTIWVGLRAGVYRYRPTMEPDTIFINSVAKRSLPITSANSIYEDSNGDIWVLLWREGLHKYNKFNNTFTHYPKIGKSNNPFKIFQDHKKRYWIATWDDGIYRFVPNANQQTIYQRLNVGNDETDSGASTVFSIVEDEANRYLWFISFSGMSAYSCDDSGILQRIDISYLFKNSNNIFSDVIKDREGNLWVCAFSEGGLTINFNRPFIDNNTLEPIRNSLGVKPNITAILEDRDGNLWMNQNRLGLVYYSPSTKTVRWFGQFDALKHNEELTRVSCLAQFSGSAGVWVGSENSSVVSLLQNRGGTIILTNRFDLAAIYPNAGTPITMVEDSKNNIWIATTTSLFCKPYNKSSFAYIKHQFGEISCITENIDGAIWVGSHNGRLSKIDVTYKTNFDSLKVENVNGFDHDLRGANIEAIAADREGNLWIGTKDGNVVMMDRKSSVLNDMSQLFAMDGGGVYNIVVDEQGNIWVSNNKNVVEYSPTNGASVNYTTSDGLCVSSFLKGSYFKNSRGDLYFAGNNGYSIFKSSPRLLAQPRNPKVLITDVKIHNRSILINEDNNGAEFDALRGRLILAPDDRNLEIDFSTLNFSFPSKIRYAYKLEGVDQDWVYAESNRQYAIYNQLKKGRYTFLVKATDENKLWSSQITKLTIYKTPHFYETWWAYLLYLLLLGAAVNYIYRLVSNRIKLVNSLKIARIEREKSEELTQAKLSYFTNISHDFLTPLTIISCQIDDIETTLPRKNPQFEIMRSNIDRLKRLLQQLLDFRKIEAGSLKLKIASGDIVSFIHNICQINFRPMLDKRNIKLNFSSTHESIEAFFDADKVDKVIFNLLSNALKYSPQGRDINVIVEELTHNAKRYVQVKVCDQGIGIAKEELDNIFIRFNNNKNAKTSNSNGIGLSFSKELVELHKGKIYVESEVGRGSTFTFEIPIDINSYNQSEICETIQPSINEEDIQIFSENIDPAAAFALNESVDENRAAAVNILIVEDNEELLYTMKRVLSKNFRVYTAPNGLIALNIINSNDIDIVISDIMMPEMDGLELCRTLKNNIETRHIPVLLLTARISSNDRIESYSAGADGYISKPFEIRVLEARINNFIINRQNKQIEFKSNMEINISALNYPSQDESFLNRAVEIIEQFLDDTEFDVISFASKLNMSKSTLYKKLKTMTGLSPVEFIRNIRLKHSCRMLRDRSIPISEVAYKVGFSDPKYFTLCFRQEFGTTPSKFQKDGILDES